MYIDIMKLFRSVKSLAIKSVVVVVLALLSVTAANAQYKRPTQDEKIEEHPRNVTVLDEHKDGKGNIIRTIQYNQGLMRVTETIIRPEKLGVGGKVAINPDTMNKSFVEVLVDKSHYCVYVMYRKRMIRAYKAVFGPKPQQLKMMEGDRCTPEGWFTIQNKNPASRYDKFMLLSYPDDSARARFNRAKEAGTIPRTAKIGGDVGIHGIWQGGDDMIELGVGWTDGCIAIKNKDVEELYTMVGVGTRVHIIRGVEEVYEHDSKTKKGKS